MASETVLVVDDNPLSLKLTRILLINEGYKVVTAGSLVDAVELLRSLSPDLVLADLASPDMDGLELARRLKQDEKTRALLVMAAAKPGDEQKAFDAGCDAYVAKPFDARALAPRVRALLDGRAIAGGARTATNELQGLRVRFLAEGREKARDLLLQLDGRFEEKEAAHTIHQWVGTGGLLGYGAISHLSREVEAILAEQPLDNAQLRESLTNLALAFSSPRDAREAPLPESIVQALSGKRIAGVEFPVNEQQRLQAALERVGAYGTFLSATQLPDSAEALANDLIVVHVNAETTASAWLDPAAPVEGRRPMVLAGKRDSLLELAPATQSLAREFLMDSWQSDEALVRLSLALAYHPLQLQPKAAPAASVRTQVVIADDEPAVLALVRTALENFGMDCRLATDGATALEAIRRTHPQAAVLDVNMPGMDGYEVLAAVRREELPVRVLLLTARQQESDVIRGFTLGADDYVVKPFSPMELVARLKRLLAR
ncbi:MAG: response regulator [Bryobacteraceae bacterium]|jgi:DNA-binding response OmpR family regulator